MGIKPAEIATAIPPTVEFPLWSDQEQDAVTILTTVCDVSHRAGTARPEARTPARALSRGEAGSLPCVTSFTVMKNASC